MQHERMRSIQKLNFVVCAGCMIGLAGTVGGFSTDKMEVGCMALLLILFSALLVSNIFIFILLDYVTVLKRQNRHYKSFMKERRTSL